MTLDKIIARAKTSTEAEAREKRRKAITPKMKLDALGDWAKVYCAICWEQTSFPWQMHWLSDIQFDHHLALVDGGLHESANIRPVCKACHAKKSAKEHIGNSKAKRLAKAKEVHDAVVRKEAVKAESRLKSRGFPKGARGFSKAKSARWGGTE